MYKWLVKFHNGKNVKLKSLRKTREQNDITQPSNSTMASARAGIEICDKKLKDLRPMAYAIKSRADSDVPHEPIAHKLHHEWPYKMNMDNK